MTVYAVYKGQIAMPVAPRLKRHLAAHPAQYRVRKAQDGESLMELARSAGVRGSVLARAVLLKAGDVQILAVFPADRELDLDALTQVFRRRPTFCTEDEVRAAFPDCDATALPPFGLAYGIKTIVDRRLERLQEVFFATGVPGHFVRAGGTDFRRLLGRAWLGAQVSRAVTRSEPTAASDLRERVEQLDKLPAMPGIAAEIVRIRNNPYANASELAAVIEQDPSLAAQLIRYACSPFYGYQGKVESVETAIVRVLGMDFVLDFAFALSLGRTLRTPRGGPLGLDRFWEHALHSATLAQGLCNTIEFSRRPWSGLAYLAGLLHNFGFLLLGHLFPEEFERLNAAVTANPDQPVTALERETLGVTHCELGEWLMRAWDLPDEVVEAVRHHHDPDYRSEFSEYANLVCVANRLLQRAGIGDEATGDVPPELLAAVGVSPARAEQLLERVLADRESLAFMAQKMAA